MVSSQTMGGGMKLVSVNVSLPKEVPFQGGMVKTCIFQEPVVGRVMLRRENLDGDRQADRSVHGGVHKAAYAYPREHYGDWSRELGRSDFTFGQFGENFTVEGMLEDEIRIGDAFTVKALWSLAYRERDNLEGAKAALRLTSLGPEWRHLLANRLIKAGIPVE